jgi:phage tail tape-measure protein
MASVGAVALALGLAFGIGGRDTAAEVVRNWYERSRAMSRSKAEEASQEIRTERPH